MVLQRWDPFRDMVRMERAMDRMWRGPHGHDGASMSPKTLPLDVLERGEDIVIRASLPGMDPNDINATLEGNVLTIRGQTEAEAEHQDAGYVLRERRTGAFHRTLRLPNTVDTDKVSTRYEAGVLTVTFPKLEVKKAKQLKVEVEAG